MEQIKFRGKSLKTGEWVFGSYVFTYNCCYIFNSEYCLIGEDDPTPYFVEVDGKTVGQLLDIEEKSGKELYEGDICKVHVFTQELGENMGVREGELEFMASLNFCSSGVSLESGGENSGPIWAYGGFHEESLELVGNIYDNPDLLPIDLTPTEADHQPFD